MKVKYAFLALAPTIAALLCGCGSGLSYQSGLVTIKNANIDLSYPKDWETLSGDEVYGELYEALSEEYGSAEELKKMYEDNGERLLFKAKTPGGEASALFSEANRGDTTAKELLSAAKNALVMNVNSAGYHAESSLEEKTWGGVSGVMMSVGVSEKKGEPAMFEEREFCFERGELVYSLKIHIDSGYESEAEGVEISALE